MAKRRRSVHQATALRLRARRSLSSFISLRREAEERLKVFEAARLERMLRSGHSHDAERYLDRFVVPIGAQDMSRLCRLLKMYVRVFRIISTIAAGGQEGAMMAALYANPSERALRHPYNVRLHNVLAMFREDHTRASTSWHDVKSGVVDRIMGYVARCPELQGEVRMPRKRLLLWAFIPHGLQPCPSRCRKTTKRAPADVIIRKFLQKRPLSIQEKTHADLHLASPSMASLDETSDRSSSDQQPTQQPMTDAGATMSLPGYVNT